MKSNFTKKIGLGFLIISLLILNTSCSKTGNDDGSNNGNGQQPPVADSALFMFVHASASTAGVDFRMTPKSLGGNLINVPYLNASTFDGSNYVSRPAVNTEMSTYSNSTNICYKKENFLFAANKKYSIFLIDTLSNLQIVTVEDILVPLATDKAGIRFFNFGNKNTAIDLSIAGSNTKIFENRIFNDQVTNPSYSAFSSIKSGSYTFEMREAASSLGAIQSTSSVHLQAGKFYTLYLRGHPRSSYSNGTLGATLISHN